MPVETPPPISSAIAICLRPIARLCIHFGIDLRTLTEMMKVAFVNVAREEFKVSGKAQTDSRIALLTGVHRKDVRRILGRAPEKSSARNQSLLANLIAQWLGTPELNDASGQTKPIPRNPHPDHKHSFISLAGALTNDIHPRALLDECLNRGIVRVDVDDMVHLVEESLIPESNLDEKAHFFSQTIHDHISAAEHNLNGSQPPFLDRFVWHEGLTEDDVDAIAATARKAAMSALKTVNNQAVERKQKNLDSGANADRRMHFGTFYYSTRVDVRKSEDLHEDQ